MRRIVRDLKDRDDDIATYAAMNVLRLKDITEAEILELIPVLRKATTGGSISVRFFSRKALNEVKLAMRRFPNVLSEIDQIREETRRSSWTELLEGLLEAPVDHKLIVFDLLKDVEDPKVLPALTRYLEQERDEFIVAEVVRILGLLGGPAELGVLEPLLKHPDSRIRSNAVEAMEHLGGKEVVQAILPLLEDDDNRVRATVARILSQHGEQHVVIALARMLRSFEVWMRESAIHALGHVPYVEAVDLLLEALVDANPDVQLKAVESLDRLRPRRALEYLQTFTAGADASVQPAAQRLLEKLSRSGVDYPHIESEETRAALQRGGRKRGAAGHREKASEKELAPGKPEAEAAPPGSGGLRGRLFGRKKRREDDQELAGLRSARDEALAELGKQVMQLYREKQLSRPYLAVFEQDVKKILYLMDQKKTQKQELEKETRKTTLVGFIRGSMGYLTQEKQVEQRLDSFNSRLTAVYRDVGRKIAGDYDPADPEMLMLKGLPENVRKMDARIERLETRLAE